MKRLFKTLLLFNRYKKSVQKRTDFFDNSFFNAVPDKPLATRNKPHNNQLCADLSRFISAYSVVSHFLRFAWQTTSKQEVKDEYKQLEGDPQIKGKIKRKQQEMAQQRMMQEVPSADVVVRNPTHYAVALKYDRKTAYRAPVVVAKGTDALALRIVAVAQEHNVYITENRPLARGLYEAVDIGQEIPREFYTAVAEVLAMVYEEQHKTLPPRER